MSEYYNSIQAKVFGYIFGRRKKCSKCKEVIHPHTVYYIATERAAVMEPLCIFCKDNKPRPSRS